MSSFGFQPAEGIFRTWRHHIECRKQMRVGTVDLEKCKYWARWWSPKVGARCDIHKEEGSVPIKYVR